MQTVMQPAEYGEDSAILARLELWRTAWAMFKDYPLGVGIGQFKYVVEDYDTGRLEHAFGLPRRVTHNTYLLCASELGFHGLIVFMALLGLSLWKVRVSLKLAGRSDDPPEARLLAYGCLLSLVVYMTTGAFTDRLYTESFWWVAALPVLLERAVQAEVLARRPSAVAAKRRPVTLASDLFPDDDDGRLPAGACI
jgi:O-antigen ligase